MVVPTALEGGLRFLILSVALLSLFAAGPSHADEGWTVRFDLLNLSVLGNDTRIAVQSEEVDGEAGVVRHSQAFDLQLDSDQTVRLEVGHRSERWGWSLDGNWFDGPDGRVMLGPLTSDSASGTRTIFQAEALGRTVVAPELGSGELYLHAQSHYYHWTFNANVSRELCEGEGSELLLTAGLKLARYEDRINQNLFVLGAEGWGLVQDGRAVSDLMVGPVVGIKGRAQVSRHSFEGSFSQGVIVGDVTLKSVVHDTGPGGTDDEYHYTRRGRFAVPISEMRLRWDLELGKGFSVGMGAVGSVWWDVPVSPIRTHTEQPSTGRENTIVVGGVFLAAAWKS